MLLAPILGEEEEEGYVDIDGLYKRWLNGSMPSEGRLLGTLLGATELVGGSVLDGYSVFLCLALWTIPCALQLSSCHNNRIDLQIGICNNREEKVWVSNSIPTLFVCNITIFYHGRALIYRLACSIICNLRAVYSMLIYPCMAKIHWTQLGSEELVYTSTRSPTPKI
jgi:hypothetical protein